MGGEVTAVRKQLLLDTDVMTFSLAILGLLGCAGLAIRDWHQVLQLRASPHRAAWQDYFGFVYALWIFVGVKGDPKVVRAVRLLVGLLLVVMSIPIAASLMHLSRETARALSLWSELTSAFLFTTAALFLLAWFRGKFRDARQRSNLDKDSVKEQL
jgi:hypothetical protein